MANKIAKRSGKIQTAILLRTLVPMLLMGIVIAISSTEVYKSSLKHEIGETLYSTAISVAVGLDEMYPGHYELVGDQIVSLYKGEKELTGDYIYIDNLKRNTGIDLTLFYQNTRILTTLKDKSGVRYTSTGVNSAVYNAVSQAGETQFFQVAIDNEEYYACYYPIYLDGEIICMIGAAKPISDINEAAQKSMRPIIYITIISSLLAGFICISYTGGMVSTINKLDRFLEKMKMGDLSSEMESEVLKRNDELGNTAKAIKDMQNAIRVLVERDPLTSLYNRRYGSAKLKNIQKTNEKNGMPFSLALGDIDFFKKVNDTYGHEAGDVVLKKVSEIMRKNMAGKGFVARWGGEEFLMVFSRQNSEFAEKEVNNILEQVRKTEILYDDLIIKITMSFGVLEGNTTVDYGALLRKVDDRLYYAKTHGRNRICSSEENAVSENDENNIIEENVKTEGEISNEEIKTEISINEESKNENYNIANDDKFIQLLLDKMAEKVMNDEDSDK